jgi:site-specific recombinase XerC
MRDKGLAIGSGYYGLRHRFGTEAVKSGVSLRVVACLMGHAKITTTEGYTNTVGEDMDFMQAEIKKAMGGVMGHSANLMLTEMQKLGHAPKGRG